MAVRTWTAAVDSDWTNTGNWAEGAAPIDGDTIDIQSNVAPTNIPDQAGWTLYFQMTGSTAVTAHVNSFLHTTNPAAVQDVTIGNPNAFLYLDADINGNLTINTGTVYVNLDPVVVYGSISVGANGTLGAGGFYLDARGAFTVAGLLYLWRGVIDAAENIVLQDGATVNLSNGGEIYGGIDAADEATVTWTNINSDATDIYLDDY